MHEEPGDGMHRIIAERLKAAELILRHLIKHADRKPEILFCIETARRHFKNYGEKC